MLQPDVFEVLPEDDALQFAAALDQHADGLVFPDHVLNVADARLGGVENRSAAVGVRVVHGGRTGCSAAGLVGRPS